MNYIPGFSNHLETALPRYADGGPVMGGAALTPEEREARRIAANTPPPGTSIVGPYAGKKGLSFGDDNTFDIYDEQEVRVVDGEGNVIFTGTGVDGANRAVAIGQSLSNDLGKNANFKIQKGERTIKDGSVSGTRYIDVAYAAPSQSGLGFLADNVLPFAAAFIPGIGPVAGAALGSAISSGLQGRSLEDALVRAAIAGGSAYAGGQLFGPATPGATPTPGGNIASAAIPTGAAIPPSAFDGILVNATRAVAPSLVGSAVGGALGSGLSSVTNFKTPAEKFADQPLPEAFQPPVDPYAGLDPIVVSGTRVPPVVPNYGGALSGVFEPIATDFLPKGGLPEQLSPEPAATEPADDSIVVTGRELETLTPDELMATLGGVGGLATATAGNVGTSTQQNKTAEDLEAEKNPMVVTGRELETLTPDELMATLGGVGGLATTTTGGGDATDPAQTDKDGKKLGLEEYLRLLALGIGAVGGGGGSGSPGTYTPGGRGLNPIFTAQLPSAGGLGTIGANRTVRPLGDVDWLTYGERPELNFFDYTRTANPPPVTTPVPNNPAGPSMYAPDVDDMRFARGGAMPAKRGGASKRTEFAVNGPGTGRSDDIPAVLSDGEYVIDAETVALLGDGSSKAGAKKLDELRVKVRKHKGKKLAKGRFSANAKKPEAYLSGGRI